MINVAMHVS